MPTRAFLDNGLGIDRRFGVSAVEAMGHFLSGDLALSSDRHVRLARGKPSVDRWCVGDVASAGCIIEGVQARRPRAPPSNEKGDGGAVEWQ